MLLQHATLSHIFKINLTSLSVRIIKLQLWELRSVSLKIFISILICKRSVTAFIHKMLTEICTYFQSSGSLCEIFRYIYLKNIFWYLYLLVLFSVYQLLCLIFLLPSTNSLCNSLIYNFFLLDMGKSYLIF